MSEKLYHIVEARKVQIGGVELDLTQAQHVVQLSRQGRNSEIELFLEQQRTVVQIEETTIVTRQSGNGMVNVTIGSERTGHVTANKIGLLVRSSGNGFAEANVGRGHEASGRMAAIHAAETSQRSGVLSRLGHILARAVLAGGDPRSEQYYGSGNGHKPLNSGTLGKFESAARIQNGMNRSLQNKVTQIQNGANANGINMVVQASEDHAIGGYLMEAIDAPSTHDNVVVEVDFWGDVVSHTTYDTDTTEGALQFAIDSAESAGIASIGPGGVQYSEGYPGADENAVPVEEYYTPSPPADSGIIYEEREGFFGSLFSGGHK